MTQRTISANASGGPPGRLAPQRHEFSFSAVKQGALHWSVLLLLLASFVPWTIQIGSLRLPPYRLVLLVTLIPCLRMWLAGKAGPKRKEDVLVFMYALWSSFSLFVNHGLGLSFQPAGITFVETLGAYLIARCYIRNADDFYRLFRFLFKILLVLWPFALLELFGHPIWRDMFAAVWPVQEVGGEPPRSGLHRVQMGFDHPILFGVCIGAMLAPAYLVLGFGKSFFQRCIRGLCVGTLAMMSVSAGPLIVLIVQAALLLWSEMFKRIKQRWQILTVLLLSIGLAVELVANRSLLTIVVSLFLFESDSYWYRVQIWEFGTASVANHLLFGTGLNEWERPFWMASSSIDNFWLFSAVRYGLPAPILIGLAVLSAFQALALKKGLDEMLRAYRTAILISLFALCTAAWTVAFWDASYVLFLFLIGSGMWILDQAPEDEAKLEVRGSGYGTGVGMHGPEQSVPSSDVRI